MKKITMFLALITFIGMSCTRVAPNYYGVLMENYGKSGKSDYTKVSGRVNTAGWGTELFQVPAWEQRGSFGKDDNSGESIKLKASDNTEFTSKPIYSYKVIESRVVDLVFNNSRLGSGNDFLSSLEDNVLEPRILDLMKEESRKYSTDTLMASGGSLLFEKRVEKVIKEYFEQSGLQLVSYSSNLDFSEKVKDKINTRNEVNTNISVLDQQIAEQKKRNELEALKSEQNLIRTKGITPALLQQQFIEKWDGKTPLYSTPPVFLKQVQ